MEYTHDRTISLNKDSVAIQRGFKGFGERPLQLEMLIFLLRIVTHLQSNQWGRTKRVKTNTPFNIPTSPLHISPDSVPECNTSI